MNDRSGDGPRSDKFRRPQFDVPPPEEDAGNLPAIHPARGAEELGMVLAPLKDLAEAFRANSETLKSLAEGQARISKRLERTDRSEAVIQSTKALNDTFRGVQRSQERLYERLDEERKRPFLLLGALILGLAILVGGALWLLLGWLDRREAGGERERSETIAGLVSEHGAIVEDLQGKLIEAERTLSAQRERIEAASIRAADLEARIDELSVVNQGLRRGQADLERLLGEKANLSAEVSRLTAEYDRAGRELSRSQAREADLADEMEELQAKFNDLARRAAVGTPAAAPVLPSGPKPEDASAPAPSGAEVAAPEAVPAGAVTSLPELERLVKLLNGLLAQAGGTESHTFESIGGVRGKILYNVSVANRDDGGREAKRIEASECRIFLDPAQRRVELQFTRGHIVYYGVKAPFWGSQFRVSVVDVDPGVWRRSGLTVFEELR